MKRFAVGLGLVIAVGVAGAACGGASTSSGSLGHGASSGGGSSGGGNGSSSSGGGSASDDGGSGSGDDGGGGSSSSSSGGSFNLSGWTCPSDTVLGGYSAACVSCLETMCTSQLTMCMTASCSTCESPVFTCETASCMSPCTPGGGADGGTVSGGEGGAGAGTCAGLMKCCPLVSAVDPNTGSACSPTAATGNQMSCQTLLATILGVAPQLGSYCQ